MKSKKAISLVVLVITVIVLSILATTVIITISDTNIISQASNSVEQNQIAQEKETISVAITQAILRNKRNELVREELQNIVNEKLSEEKEIYEAEGKYYIYVEESNRTYSVDIDSYSVELEDNDEYEIAKYIAEIKKAYNESVDSSSTNAEIFQKVQQKLNYENAEYDSSSVAMVISTKWDFTLIEDGSVKKGRYAYLSVADGAIDIYSTYYTQGEKKVEYTAGDYTITGKSSEYGVRMREDGTYNITFKDLTIDVSSIGSSLSAFNGNYGRKTDNLFLNIFLDGTNYLKGCDAPALSFAYGTPNVGGVTTGSTLSIQGEGSLELHGCWANPAIGSGYTGWESCPGDANNIIINSGTILAYGYRVAATIGGALRKNVNNIVINGGDVNVIQTDNGSGIGDYSGTTKNVVVNGGNIVAKGGEYGAGIEGEGITINGGIIKTYSKVAWPAIGVGSSSSENCNITINGGTVVTYHPTDHCGPIHVGLGHIVINGGSLISRAFTAVQTSTAEDGSETVTKITTNPTDGTNTLYATPVKLENVGGGVKIEKITFSDNIQYGVTDMYTSELDTEFKVEEEGVIYLYLPEGTRTVTIVAGKKTYTGTITTATTNSVVVLSEK